MLDLGTLFHLFYLLCFTLFGITFKELDSIKAKCKKIADEQYSEEQQHKDSLRMQTMQDEIDSLKEHERIFDALVTRLYERMDKLDKPEVPEEHKEPVSQLEYVDYHMY